MSEKSLAPKPETTLTEAPEFFLERRVQRFLRLLDMSAPDSIVEGELRLIEQALEACKAKHIKGATQ